MADAPHNLSFVDRNIDKKKHFVYLTFIVRLKALRFLPKEVLRMEDFLV